MIDTPTVSRDTAAPEAGGLSRRDKTVIAVLLVSTFVVILNETIMSVAIPVLIKELSIDANTGQWLSTAFLLTMAVIIPVTGFLIQRVQTRTLFVLAMSLFSLGTLMAAVAPGFGVLLTARIVQGSGTAIMVPLLMTTVMTIVPEASRGRMMGNISVVISVAPALGPTVSGLVLSQLSWRWMFLVVLPIALVALVIGGRMVTNVGETRHVPIDVLSVPLAALGFGGLVYALNSAGATTHTDGGASIWVPGGVGAIALVVFLLRQRALQRTDRALLDLRPFTSRIFTAAVISASVAMIALLGTSILLPLYLQNVLRATPLETGLLVLPGGVTMGLLAPFVGRAYDRVGPRALLIPGSVIVIGALGLLSLLTAASPIWFVLVAHIILSAGLALVLTPLFTAGLGAVPSKFTSYGSAIFATAQQVGGAAGTTLMVAVLSAQTVAAQSGGADAVSAQVQGYHLGFLVAAGVSVVMLIAATFVAKPQSNRVGADSGALVA